MHLRAWCDLGSGLEGFEDVGYEGAGELAGEALDGGGILLDEAGQIGGGLVLLAEDVVVVFVEGFAVAAGEGDGSDHGDEEAGGLLVGGVVGEGRDGFFEDGSVEDGVGVAGGVGHDAEAGASGELAEDRLGEDHLCVIGLSVGGEDGHGERLDAGRQMGGGAEGVISATGDREERGGDGGEDEGFEAHDSS